MLSSNLDKYSCLCKSGWSALSGAIFQLKFWYSKDLCILWSEMLGMVLCELYWFVVVGAHCHASSLLCTAFLLSWESLHWRLADFTKKGFQTGSFSSLKERFAGQSWKTYLGCVALLSHIWKCLNVRGETETTLTLPEVVRAKFSNEMWMAWPLSVMFIAIFLSRLWFKSLAYVISLSIPQENPWSQIVLNRNINVHTLN